MRKAAAPGAPALGPRAPRGARPRGGPADLADEDDRVCLRVRREQLEDVEECRPDDRVATDADARRLAEAGVGHRLDGLVRERAGARDDADATPPMDGARDDADLRPSGGRGARAVRADKPPTPARERLGGRGPGGRPASPG